MYLLWLTGDMRSTQREDPWMKPLYYFGMDSQAKRKSIISHITVPQSSYVPRVSEADETERNWSFFWCIILDIHFHIHLTFIHPGTNRQKLLLQKGKLIAFDTSHLLGWKHNWYFYIHLQWIVISLWPIIVCETSNYPPAIAMSR